MGQPEAGTDGVSGDGRLAWLALAVALVAQTTFLARSIRANSATFDEGMHIAAGYRYWQCGDHGINPEHPPLVKRIAAFPVRHWPIDTFTAPCGQRPTTNEELLGEGYRLINGPRGDELLLTARTTMLLFPLALTVAAFCAARSWFGPTAAALAAVLAACEPNLAAHGPLVATDAAVALGTLVSVAAAWWYAERPSPGRAALLGLGLGIALAAKHSGVLVPAIAAFALGAVALSRRAQATRRSIAVLAGGWLFACAIALGVLWATYGFRYSALPPGALSSFDLAGGSAPSDLLRGLVGVLARHHLLPESYLAGLLYVRDNAVRNAYFFGRELPAGAWYYFPAVLAIKTTLPLLALAGVALAGRKLWRARALPLVFVLLPVAGFLAAAMASGMNIGVRHILPVYPFLVILAAAGAAERARRSYAQAAVVAALVAWHAGSFLSSHPHSIAYANEAWGGSAKLHLYLGDSNVDWGQSLYQVRDYVGRQDVGECWIAWFGMRKPAAAGIRCGTLPGPMFLEAADDAIPPLAPARFAGTVFVSATLTEYALFPYTSFRGRVPVDVIGGSVLVFRGEFDLPEVAAERHGARGWWLLKRGRLAEGRAELELAARASRSPIVGSLLRAVPPEPPR